MPRLFARIALPAFLAASALALAGCSAPAGAGDGTLQVVATTTQMGDVVREIVGDDAEVTQLLQPGQSSHSYDPTPEALTALSVADVLVISGSGLEEWLDDTIEASGFDGELVDASADVHLHEGEAHDDGSGATAASEQPAAADSDDDHEHGGTDPHVWSDPHQVVHMAETIGAALAAADTANADAIEASTAEYVAQLEALDAWVTDSIAQVPVE